MKGPYPIICRGHSGSRLLCEAFQQNGIWMGTANNRQRDAKEFEQHNPVVRFLIQEGFRYAGLPDEEKLKLQKITATLIEQLRDNCPDPENRIAYGWKRAVSTYTCEMFLDAFPESKTVHLIRDGRDVMLSRLQSRMHALDDPMNRLVVFGDASISQYRGKPLTQEVIDEFRNEIEMEHWITAVKFGMRAARYGDRYLELRYEDLCQNPEKTMSTVFDFLDVPFRDDAKEWVRNNVSVAAIGKWRGREEELHDAMMIGEPLLTQLGYV